MAERTVDETLSNSSAEERCKHLARAVQLAADQSDRDRKAIAQMRIELEAVLTKVAQLNSAIMLIHGNGFESFESSLGSDERMNYIWMLFDLSEAVRQGVDAAMRADGALEASSASA